MNIRRDCIAGAIFALCLSIGPNTVEADTHEHRGYDHARPQVRPDTNDLLRDEKDFVSDVNSLRKSLRRHASQERIEMLRYLVREDWNQIVMDRANPSEEDQTLNLATRRIEQ